MRRALARFACTGTLVFVCALLLAPSALAGATFDRVLCGNPVGAPNCTSANVWDFNATQRTVDAEHSLTATGEFVWAPRSDGAKAEIGGSAPIGGGPGADHIYTVGSDPAGDFGQYIFGIDFDAAHDVLFLSDNYGNRVVAFQRGFFSDGEADYPVDYWHPGQYPAPVTQGPAAGGFDNDHLSAPRGVAFDSANSRLYVADTGNGRVQVLDYTPGVSGASEATFNYRATITGPDWNPSADWPHSLSVDPQTGHLYVAVMQHDELYEFDADGNLVGTLVNPASTDNYYGVSVDAVNRIVYAAKSTSADAFSLATGRLLGTFTDAFIHTEAIGIQSIDVDPVAHALYVVTSINYASAENPPVAGYAIDAPPTCNVAPAISVNAGQSVKIPLDCTDADGAPVKEFHRNDPPALGTLAVNSDRTELTYTAGAKGGSDFAEYRVITANGRSQVYKQQVNVIAPEEPPVVRKSANLSLDTGDVFIRLPGTDQWIPLKEDTLIPMGTVIDARDGKAHLTFAKPDGTTYDGVFWGGVFQVTQGGGGNPIATMKLRDDIAGLPSAAAASANPFEAIAARNRGKKKNGLWGNAKGRFRTSGRGGSATVRGTRWYVANYTYGTYFKTSRGVVTIDPIRGKNFPLKAGKSFFIFFKRGR